MTVLFSFISPLCPNLLKGHSLVLNKILSTFLKYVFVQIFFEILFVLERQSYKVGKRQRDRGAPPFAGSLPTWLDWAQFANSNLKVMRKFFRKYEKMSITKQCVIEFGLLYIPFFLF